MELTPKEEAKELLKRFESVSKPFMKGSEVQVHINPEHAKQCAFICLDEKQKTIDKMFNGYYTMPKEWQKEYDKLEEVKKEIEEL